MTGALVGFLALVGAVTLGTIAIVLAYYLATRRPTPDATVREAVTSIRWGYGVGFFVLPPALAGAQDGPAVALGGAILGFAFVLFFVALNWWWGTP